MLPAVEEYVRQHWGLLPTTISVPARITCALEAVGVSKACVFAFAPGSRDPVCVVKMARTPHYNAALKHEYGSVEEIREQMGSHIRGSTLSPLHTGYLQGHFVALETFLAGRTMSSVIAGTEMRSTQAAQRHLGSAASWLAGFHRHGLADRQTSDGAAARSIIRRTIAQFEENSELDDAGRRLVARLQELGEVAGDSSIPLVYRHGDFEPGNILLDGDRVIVTDWQFAEREGLPLLDLLNLVVRYCFIAHGLEGISDQWERYRTVFREALLQSSWLTAAAAPVIRTYLEAIDLNVSVPFFLALTLMTNANKLHGFLTDRANRGYVYMVRASDEESRPYDVRLRDQLYVRLVKELAEPGAFEALRVLEVGQSGRSSGPKC